MGRFSLKPSLLAWAVFLLAAAGSVPSQAEQLVRLSSSTGTGNTGLLTFLLPAFEKSTGIRVEVVPEGADGPLRLAEKGEVDVILVHSPLTEKIFVDAGYGVNRRTVMANYYVIVGPPGDPVGVVSAENARDAFRAIAGAGYPFVSRGDRSGTHEKEEAIWKEAMGAAPRTKPWYLESGKSMVETLALADTRGAYTLSDSGTFQMVAERMKLRILFRKKTQLLYNPYSVIAVNPARHASVNYMGTMQLIAFLTSPEGQKMIGEFTDTSGNRPFTPLTGRE